MQLQNKNKIYLKTECEINGHQGYEVNFPITLTYVCQTLSQFMQMKTPNIHDEAIQVMHIFIFLKPPAGTGAIVQWVSTCLAQGSTQV